MNNSFRQVEEKHVQSELVHMTWSPKMDLIAVANINGEVILYRLSWQKVWTRGHVADDVKVTSLAWRPDGRILAASYSNGQTLLYDIEDASVVHTIQLRASAVSMTWASKVKGSKTKSNQSNEDSLPTTSANDQSDLENKESLSKIFEDKSALFLPKLPSFPKSYTTSTQNSTTENFEDIKKLKEQKDLNILILGTEDSHVLLYVYGIFPIAVINVRDESRGQNCRVVSTQLSEDFQMLSVVLQSECSMQSDEQQQSVHWLSFDAVLICSRDKELQILAHKFGQILALMKYLDMTIQQMMEAWEDILLEMDSKLMKLAEDKKSAGDSSVSNDFLRLLMFGIPSNELQMFLLTDLTERGLKKLGHSIESSYSNIQKLVLKHLQSVGQALMYHFEDVRGMSLWYDRFGILGLLPSLTEEAIRAIGSFMLKAAELQQVIDGSMKNFKAFFRWLYIAIQRLSNERIPPELNKMTQQDLSFVAEFLKDNFADGSDLPDSKRSGFKLEKVGQYLKSENLVCPVDNSNNPWIEFLRENPKLAASPLLYENCPERSLIQLHAALQLAIDNIINRCADGIGQSITCYSTTALFNLKLRSGSNAPLRISQLGKRCDNLDYIYLAFTSDELPANKFFVGRQVVGSTQQRGIEIVGLTLDEIKECSENATISTPKRLLDLAFYNDTTLSVLLEEQDEERVPTLAQALLANVEKDSFTRIDNIANALIVDSALVKFLPIKDCLDSLNCRQLENMVAYQMAVSGQRKVACVLFVSRKRVRLFLMDAEDEEEVGEQEAEESSKEEDSMRSDENKESSSVTS